MPTDFQREFGGMDLTAKSTLGFRTWDVDRYGRLIGLNKFIWRPGENLATCNAKLVQSMKGALLAYSYTPPSAPRERKQSWLESMGFIPRKRLESVAPPTPTPLPVEDVQFQSCNGADPSCECGFYAYYRTDVSEDFGAVGVIEGYGKVTIGPRGFRSMKAKVLALCLNEKNRTPFNMFGPEMKFGVQGQKINAAQVRVNYPEVRFFGDVDSMLSEFPPDQPPTEDPNQPGFWERRIVW